MQNNIEEDLKLFNKLANDFLKEEKLKPLSNYIKPQELYNKIDLTLKDHPGSIPKSIIGLGRLSI